METTSITKYLAMCEDAMDRMAMADACFPVTENITFAHVQAAHVHVAAAHKRLCRARRVYRRRMLVRRFIYWGEMEAVAMGYLSFTEVEKP